MGFYVYEITPEKFASDGGEKIGSITVICDGASVPKSLEESLERYLTQNGSLRPAFREYLKSGDFFSSGKGKREEKKITEYAHVDPEGELSYWCKFVSADGREYAAENGGELKIDAGIYTVEVGVGNLAAATWLSGSGDGDVMLKVGKKYIPLEKDVRYLSDGVARGEYSVNFAEKIELRLSARGRADFGEIFRISIKI